MKKKFIKRIKVNNTYFDIYVVSCKLLDFDCYCDNDNHCIYINASLFNNGSYNNFMFSMLDTMLKVYFIEYNVDYIEDETLLVFLREKLFDIFDNIYDNDLIGRIEDKFKSEENFSDFVIDSVSIMGVNYKILLNKSNLTHNILGQTNHLDKIVIIDYSSYNQDELKETILHEFLHAYFYECSLHNYCKDENLIKFIEHIFFNIIADIWDFNFLIKVEKVSNKLLKVV